MTSRTRRWQAMKPVRRIFTTSNALSFSLGAVVTHYLGFSHTARVPEGLSIAIYVAILVFCTWGIFSLVRMRRKLNSIRSRRERRGR